MRLWVWAILLFVECRARSKPDAGMTSPATSIAEAAASSALIVDAAAPGVRFAFARFGKNGVDECIDVEIQSRDGDAGVAIAKFKKGVTAMQQPCVEAFSDRPELARCDIRAEDDAGTFVIAGRYYDALTLDDDQYMKQCLEAEGKWHAMRKDSPEYARSRLRGHAKHMQDLTGP